MPNEIPSQQATSSRCDLCGRETNRPKPYRVYSTVDSPSILEGGGEEEHDFVVCPECENRKIYYLAAAITIMAVGVVSVLKSDDPTIFIIAILLTVLLAAGSGRFLPFQRLARRVRSERGAAVAAASPNLSFRVITSAVSLDERARLTSPYRAASQPPLPTEEKEVQLDGILIFFNNDFNPKDAFINAILTKMKARGRTYREWMTDKTPLGVFIDPDTKDPTMILARAAAQFRSMGISFSADNVEPAPFEGTQGRTGTVVAHWSPRAK